MIFKRNKHGLLYNIRGEYKNEKLVKLNMKYKNEGQFGLGCAKVVKENEADIGFGFDGDGDRVGVIDEQGNEIFSDKIGLLIARNLSEKHNGAKFIVDVKSTGLYSTDKILAKNNCNTLYWKTGHSHIKRKVNIENALAGFEKSGHFFFNEPFVAFQDVL